MPRPAGRSHELPHRIGAGSPILADPPAALWWKVRRRPEPRASTRDHRPRWKSITPDIAATVGPPVVRLPAVPRNGRVFVGARTQPQDAPAGDRPGAAPGAVVIGRVMGWCAITRHHAWRTTRPAATRHPTPEATFAQVSLQWFSSLRSSLQFILQLKWRQGSRPAEWWSYLTVLGQCVHHAVRSSGVATSLGVGAVGSAMGCSDR